MKNLSPISMARAEFERAQYRVNVDLTVSLEDVLRPSFWAHHHGKVKKGDLIEVFGDHLYVDLIVKGSGVGYVEVLPLRIWQSEEIQAIIEPKLEDLPAIPDGYDVKRGPGGRWRVMVKEPLLEVEKGILTEAKARELAIAHFNKANAVAA